MSSSRSKIISKPYILLKRNNEDKLKKHRKPQLQNSSPNIIPLNYELNQSCCRLGEELYREKNIITETENFFSMPALGPMGIPGYLLLCSKKHYLGYSNIPNSIILEFEEFFALMRKRLKKLYNLPTIAFEHGPSHDGFHCGNSLDHAHIHILPTKQNIKNILPQYFTIFKITHFHELNKNNLDQTAPYVFFEDQQEKRYLLKPKKPLESQFLRKIICKVHDCDCWNWKEHFGLDTFLDTLNLVRGDVK